jgi:flagellar basal body-associated protein FliL
MKQKDILLIAVIAIAAAAISFLTANFFFGGEKAYKLTAPKIEPITQSFNLPDQTVFNNTAINPTKNVTIGDTTNSSPFKAAQ